MDEELSKPQIEQGDTKISFMTEIEPSEMKKQLEEQVEKKVAKLGKSKVALDMAEKMVVVAIAGKEKQGMFDLGIQMAKFVEAQKELDRAEAKFRSAKLDLEEFEEFQEDELNRCNPDEDAEIIPIDSSDLKEHDKDCGLCNPDGEGDYVTIEELQERMGIVKNKDDMLSREEIVKLKRMLQQDDEILNAEDMEKLQNMIGSPTKEASTSPTIARMMPTNSIVASQKDIIEKVVVLEKDGVIVKEDEVFSQETKGGEGIPKGERIRLMIEPEFLKAKKRCPKCNAKTKIKSKVINKVEGKFANIKIRCKNTKRKWYWLWLKKPRCDYLEEYNERID